MGLRKILSNNKGRIAQDSSLTAQDAQRSVSESSDHGQLQATVSTVSVPPKGERLGMHILFEPTEPPALDIVAIHGLGGDPFDTWTHTNKTLWLRDFLPADIPNARIMTFGYDAGALRAPKDRALPMAEALLLAIRNKRPGTAKKRPLFLIGHSLGGIVIKEALVFAQARQNLHSDTLKSVRHLMFFGTPHQGTDTYLVNLKKVLQADETSVLSQLKLWSPSLIDANARFAEIADGFTITTFYENKETHGFMVVPEGSARLSKPKDREGNYNTVMETLCYEVSTLGEIEEERQHEARVQFLINTLPAMDMNLDKIHEDIEAGRERVERALDAGSDDIDYFKTSDYVLGKDFNNAKRVSGTGGWLFDRPKFQEWNAAGTNNPLWITADPGCGKSTLCRALVDDKRLLVHGPALVAYYFFKDNEQQNSLTTALCALLHQIFCQKEDLFNKHARKLIVKRKGLKNDINGLWDLFKNVVTDQNDHMHQTIICVLDAVDECKGQDRRNLIARLEDFYTDESTSVTRRARLSILLTSRPYKAIKAEVIEISGGGAMENRFNNRIAGEDPKTETGIDASILGDVDLVISEGIDLLRRIHSLSEDDCLHLKQSLTRNPNRTLLWIGRIWQPLRRALGSSRRNLDKIIAELPPDMNATYERMLNEAMKAPDGGAKVRIALHITLAANRPLSVLEMNTAMAAYGGVTSFADIEEETAEYYRNLCGFVLTVTNDTIFFFHQTVKDFLLSPLGELDVVTKSFGWKHSFHIGTSHRIMAQACMQTLHLKDEHAQTFIDRIQNFIDHEAPYCSARTHQELWALTSERIDLIGYGLISKPLSRYAIYVWPEHFERSASVNTDRSISAAYRSQRKFRPDWHDSLSRGLFISAELGLTALLSAAVINRASPIFQNGTIHVKEAALLTTSRRGFSESSSVLLDGCPELRPTCKIAALELAAERSHLETVAVLLTHWIAAGLPLEDFTSVALWKTIHHGRHCHEEVVETLLRNKANVDIRHGPQLRTPLHEVANRPPGEVSKKVMKILLLHRAEVKAKDRNGNTALHLLVSRVQPYEKAEISCFIEMVEILLEYGADVDAIDNSGQTVLHLAAEQVGNSQIIRVLLRYNADVNAMYKRCGMQEDALGMALRTLARVTWSRDDYEAQREVVDVLLRWKWTAAGVPKEISDAILKAELEANEYRSSEALKENRFDDAMVLQSVIGGPTKEPQGKPALHIALIYYRKYFERGQIGFLATMRELISKKAHRERWANLEATDQFGRTALHIACEAGPFRELRLDEYAIVKLLLQMMVFSKANVNAVDNDGHTALDLAQKRGYGEIVQLLSPYATASSVSDHESRHS